MAQFVFEDERARRVAKRHQEPTRPRVHGPPWPTHRDVRVLDFGHDRLEVVDDVVECHGGVSGNHVSGGRPIPHAPRRVLGA